MSLSKGKESILCAGTEQRRRSRNLSESLSAGPSIEDFIILKAISRGAFGKVYLGCKKTQPDKVYAIKAMKKDDMIQKNMIQQVIAERDALAIAKSPFVVRLFYSLQSRQQIFLVMEYMIGGDVKSLLSVCGCFEEQMAIMYTAEVILALEYLHNHHIIHRDLKPDNMLISATGHIKLTDFGLSKVSLNRQLSISDVVSTPSVTGRPSENYFRTPGQVLSLTANFSFGNNRKCGRPPCFSEYRKVTLGSSFNSYNTPDVKQMRYGTPQKPVTPRPVQSLTPTLQESLEWRQSTASEASSISLARKSRVSSCAVGFAVRAVDNTSAVMQDDVFEGIDDNDVNVDLSTSKGTVEDEIGSRNASNFKVPDSRSLSKRHPPQAHDQSSKGFTSCTPVGRQSLSVLTDDDTPLLYRTKEAIQKSYAARHLASMREGSDSIDGSVIETPSKLDVGNQSWVSDIAKEDSVCSIEMNRNMESPPPIDLCITNPKICLSMSPEQGDTPFQRKRRYDCVEKSPIALRASRNDSTGLTMEFQRFQVHSDPPSKRINVDRNSSPERSVLSFQESIVSKTPEHPDNCFAREPIKIESPSTPPNLIPPVAFIHLSSSPVLAKPGKSSQTNSNPSTVDSACQRFNPSPMSLDSSLSRTKDNYLDISGTQEMPSSSPCEDVAHDAESSLGSELNNMSSVFFPGNKINMSLTEGETSNLEASFNNSTQDSSHSISAQQPGESLLQESTVNSSDAELCSMNNCRQSSVEDHLDSERQDTDNLHESFNTNTSQEEDRGNVKKPATSTPQIDTFDEENKENCESSCKFPSKKPINKLIKKVTHFSSMPSSISSECHSADSDHAWAVSQTPCNNRKAAFKVHATPYRTPKSVRRGRPHENPERILGTPDYLAPELLLQQGHDASVDWWALGVCLFEFLTGVPPFNDETPEAVFQNILNRDIPWPEEDEALSKEAQACVDMLLSTDSQQRPTAEELKNHELFQEIDWEHLHETEMPFVPCPDDSTDTSYFDARNNMQHLKISSIDL